MDLQSLDKWDTLFGVLPKDLPEGIRYFVLAMLVRGVVAVAA